MFYFCFCKWRIDNILYTSFSAYAKFLFYYYLKCLSKELFLKCSMLFFPTDCTRHAECHLQKSCFWYYQSVSSIKRRTLHSIPRQIIEGMLLGILQGIFFFNNWWIVRRFIFVFLRNYFQEDIIILKSIK